MAAVIQIHEMSALAVGTDKTASTVLYKDADNATVDANDPLVIPNTGSVYSYSKTLRAYMQTAPDGTDVVSNLRWYTDGSNDFGTGVAVAAKNTGTTFNAHYKTAMTDGTDVFSFTGASPLDGVVTDTGPFDTASEYIGDIIELQMSVAPTATQGTLSAETLTLAYDEA